MSLLERNQDCMSLMEKIVSHVAADIHYGGGPRLQKIADELADKYPLINAAPQLREACKTALWYLENVRKIADPAKDIAILKAALAACEVKE